MRKPAWHWDLQTAWFWEKPRKVHVGLRKPTMTLDERRLPGLEGGDAEGDDVGELPDDGLTDTGR